MINPLLKIFILFLLSTFGGKTSAASVEEYFSGCDKFLHAYVKEGMVDYARIKQNPADLQLLLQFINNAPANQYEPSTAKAFYINAYNLLVIDQVVKHYPITSPMDVPGFFDREKHKIGTESLTLNEIENRKIRSPYKDARIHFVLVCAAKGCPQLAPFGYKPADLEQQLDQQTVKAINNNSFISRKGNIVSISEIFKWYYSDFANSDAELIQYINTYLIEELPINSRINYYSYDWSLNE